MKLGFICLDLPGHLNPMSALARQLQARNHEVVFLYSSGAAGLPFVRGPEKGSHQRKPTRSQQKAGRGRVQAGPALGVKGRLGRSSDCSSLLHTPKGRYGSN
jgi:hypothetical protein